MTKHSYFTPTPELITEWTNKYYDCPITSALPDVETAIATLAAQWGADQELEACCEEMKGLPSPLGIPFGEMASNALRAARRSKPPSLKEQALGLLNEGPVSDLLDHEVAVIRRALEALPDD